MKDMIPVAEAVVKQTAGVLGANSAAAQALVDAEKRRAAGEIVTFYRMDRTILVVGEKAPVSGFFVDWDGNTRRVEAPGDGYSCVVEQRGHLGVDVLDADGCVIHEATYFATLAEVEAAGIVINLI